MNLNVDIFPFYNLFAVTLARMHLLSLRIKRPPLASNLFKFNNCLAPLAAWVAFYEAR